MSYLRPDIFQKSLDFFGTVKIAMGDNPDTSMKIIAGRVWFQQGQELRLQHVPPETPGQFRQQQMLACTLDQLFELTLMKRLISVH